MAKDRRITAISNVKRIGIESRRQSNVESSIMTNTVRRNVLPCLMIAAGLGLSQAAQAAGYNPVTQQAQSKLAIAWSRPRALGRGCGRRDKNGRPGVSKAIRASGDRRLDPRRSTSSELGPRGQGQCGRGLDTGSDARRSGQARSQADQ